jgi:chromosome segregation ATPase
MIEIDKFSIQQKEIIQFKNKLIEYSELKHSYDLVQKTLDSTKEKLDTSNSSILKLKTLNNTLVDKQMEATQKLTTNRQSNKEEKETIKQLTLEIVALNDKTKELDSVILIKDSQIEENRKRMEELVSNMSESSETIQDDYQEMLLTQIKEKNEEIKQLVAKMTQIEKESQKTIKQFNTMKSQVASLINV